MEAWENIASLKEFEDYRIRKGPVPIFDQASYNLSFQRCSENKCGCFGTNWACNPGAKMDVQEYYRGIDYVIVMSRTFEISPKDFDALKDINPDMQRAVRRMVILLRDNGVECDGFLDGPCLYCGECAYPEPCRFPEMRTPSLSTLGIGLKGYFERMGETFSFEDDRVTLYGFVFVHARG